MIINCEVNLGSVKHKWYGNFLEVAHHFYTSNTYYHLKALV